MQEKQNKYTVYYVVKTDNGNHPVTTHFDDFFVATNEFQNLCDMHRCSSIIASGNLSVANHDGARTILTKLTEYAPPQAAPTA